MKDLNGDVAKTTVEVVKGVDEVLDVVNTREKPTDLRLSLRINYRMYMNRGLKAREIPTQNREEVLVEVWEHGARAYSEQITEIVIGVEGDPLNTAVNYETAVGQVKKQKQM